ncbi:MAG: hypothetical protein DWG76_07290 [Chloroflexi bacterium]|nr:hypothetical protein [Chloroflexota bacterium]
METRANQTRWLAVFAAMLLVGCGVAAPAAPTLDVKSLATQIAADVFAAISQTQEAQQATQVAAQETQVVQASPTNTAEPPAVVPTFTQTPGASTATLAPTAVTLPSSTPAPIACNAAQLVSDLTVADNSLFSTGAKFSKIWRIKNVGSCTWDSGYRIRFTDGTNLAEKSSYPLPAVVKPGESVDVSVDMTAPNKTGTFRSSWSLVSDKDVTFGVGVNAKTAVDLPPKT